MYIHSRYASKSQHTVQCICVVNGCMEARYIRTAQYCVVCACVPPPTGHLQVGTYYRIILISIQICEPSPALPLACRSRPALLCCSLGICGSHMQDNRAVLASEWLWFLACDLFLAYLYVSSTYGWRLHSTYYTLTNIDNKIYYHGVGSRYPGSVDDSTYLGVAYVCT
jgi:hypothetical protein